MFIIISLLNSRQKGDLPKRTCWSFDCGSGYLFLCFLCWLALELTRLLRLDLLVWICANVGVTVPVG
jgi:hypothetical protein